MKFNLKSKIIIPVLILLIAGSTFNFFGYKNTVQEVLTSQFISKGSSIAQALSYSAQQTILNRDAATIQGFIDQYSEINGVTYIYIKDEFGEIIAHTFTPEVPQQFLSRTPEAHLDNKYLRFQLNGLEIVEVNKPILSGIMGQVYVGMGLETEEANILAPVISKIIVVNLLIFFFSIMILAYTLSKIIKPLSSLTSLAKKIGYGENEAVRIEKTSDDEIGLLTESFNRMLDKIHRNTHNLETIVEEKTKEIQATQEKISLLFDHSPLGFAFCNMQGQLIDINKKYSNITGYTLEELKAKSYWDLTPKKYKDQEEHQLAALDVTGSYGPYRKEYIHKDGSLVPVELNGFIVENYDGAKGIWSLVEDISEKVISEKSSEEQRKIVSQTVKLASLGEMAAGVGHEINNPLSICVGNISLIRSIIDQDGLDKKALYQRLSRIEHGHDRIRKIVDGLRTYARSDTDHSEVISMREAIDQTVNLITEIYSNDGITLIRESQNVSLYTKGSLGRLQQIIMNLISNAKDATEGQSMREIRLSLEKLDENTLEFSVKDNGGGVPDELKDKILNPFFTTKGATKGTGMGLGMVNEMTQAMNGTLSFESKEGSGSYFSIRLPIFEEPKIMEVKQGDFILKDAKTILNGRALVVDDEAGIRELLVEYLEDMGLTVDEADDGDTGMKKILQTKYDFICTDMKMKRMQGDEFIFQARKIQNRDTKYFIITGGVTTHFSKEKRLNLRGLADGYIKKPFTEDALYNLLKNSSSK